MQTPSSLFDYPLDPARIAQAPVEPRDHSRLMLLARTTGEIRHGHFYDIVDELRAGDVLVFNTSKVFNARLTLSDEEVFVLRVWDGEIEALIRPGRKYGVGDALPVGQDWRVLEKTADGVVRVRTGLSVQETLEFCEARGEVPLPPYIKDQLEDATRYQTVYAKETGSVAAPTAGLHFTPELLEKLRAKGVQCEEVVLHVGLGTFRPMQTEHVEEHGMHAEWAEIDAATAERIRAAKKEGRRIIAVGTTTVRVLEGVVAREGQLQGFCGELNLFITPGFTFKVVDGLITNFHLPKSTLLVLVCAFADRERVLAAYDTAQREGYRFFSFGDAMLIV